MTKTIIPDEHNFVAVINQLTEQLPDSGFDGLSDLLLLLHDVYTEQSQPASSAISLATEKINHINKFAAVAEMHLFNAPEQVTVEKLISHISFFAEEMLLDEEDILLIQKSLMQDQASDSITSFSATFARYREQIKLALQQAEAMELSGILDVLYLVDEWQEEHAQDNCLSSASLLGCNAIIGAAQAYLSATGDQQLNIDVLVNSLGQLDDSLVLEEEDCQLLANLLIEEAGLIRTDKLGAPAENEKSTDEVTDSLQHYQRQLKLSLQQAEVLELSGLQDILYLLDEWLEGHVDTSVPESSVSACGDIAIAAQAYLLAKGDQQVNINTLLFRLGDIDDSLLLDEEDSNLLKSLLLEETLLINQSCSESPEEVQEDDIVDYDIEQDNRIEIIEIPPYLEEYVDILSIVFLPIQATIDKLYTIVQNQNSLIAIDDSDLENLKDDLEKLALIAKTAEFIGIHLSTLHIQSNQTFLKNSESTIIHETIALFHEWSFSVIDYLSAPLNDEPVHRLLAIQCSPLWPVAIKEEHATNLLIELQSLDRRAEASKAKERQHIASDEDVSLALPDDVSPVLVDSLLEELPEQTATFSAAIEHLSQGGSMEDVTVAQRVAHTLKGAGNTVNVRGIANITHHLEDILTALADENILPDTNILATLRRASDCLEEMTETLTSNSPPPLDAVEVLQEILDVASRIDNEGITQIIQANSVEIVEPEVTPIQVQQPDKSVVEEQREEKESEQMVRLPVSTVDKLVQFSDEMMINNGQLREQLKQAVAETKLLQAHLEQFHYHSMELLGHVDMQRIQQIQNQAINSANDGFDSLEMDQYNELYSTSLRIHEMTSDSREMNRNFANQLRGIDALLIEQGYLNGASQSSLLDIRTIAVQSVVPRLQRGVRQAARMSGKDIELQLSGQDLLVDKDILNSVLDPLMHLLRNAVGHGIESKADRVKSGKSEQGNIKLDFYRDKNMIAIDCIDDGGGLDLAAIKRKALKIGLMSDDSDISDDEIKQLIMQPNFSTQDEVSQISGRGVGMDAVNSGIRSLGGTLRLESQAGKGCRFHILLPLSLAHHNCLLVNVGTQTLAVAELGVEQVLLADSGVLYPEGDEYSFVFDDKKYAVKTIESLLSRVNPGQKIAMEARTFLLINQQENYFAIAVESVKSVSEMIVKDLNEVLPHIHGIIGASTLNDGSIAPVIDLQELLQEPSRWGAQTNEQFAEENPIDQTKVLVVDDSLSARRSMEQFFSDMGYQIMSARDGLDALEQLESQVPDIIVTDMEMPRVNGIELTENLRRDEATKDLPIVMITSRATAKHRTMAVDKGVNAYLTKPYSEDELSSTVLGLL